MPRCDRLLALCDHYERSTAILCNMIRGSFSLRYQKNAYVPVDPASIQYSSNQASPTDVKNDVAD